MQKHPDRTIHIFVYDKDAKDIMHYANNFQILPKKKYYIFNG